MFQLFLKAFEKCLLRGVELDDGGLDGFVVDVGAAAFDLDVPMSAGLSRDDVASVASVACVTVDPVDVGVRALWGALKAMVSLGRSDGPLRGVELNAKMS